MKLMFASDIIKILEGYIKDNGDMPVILGIKSEEDIYSDGFDMQPVEAVSVMEMTRNDPENSKIDNHVEHFVLIGNFSFNDDDKQEIEFDFDEDGE